MNSGRHVVNIINEYKHLILAKRRQDYCIETASEDRRYPSRTHIAIYDRRVSILVLSSNVYIFTMYQNIINTDLGKNYSSIASQCYLARIADSPSVDADAENSF